jgi:hypothetical protein
MERMPHHGRWQTNGLDLDVRRRSAEDADLRTLIRRLSSDATQFVHDEIELGKLELRRVSENLSADLSEAGRTVVRDITRLGVALVLASLAAATLTVAAFLGVGLLVGAYWAGALIVGIILAIAAAVFARSAATDMKDSDALRFENTRRAGRHSTAVIADEGQRTREFVSEEGAEFKRRATGSPVPPRAH